MDTPEHHEAPIRVHFGSGLHAAAGRPVDAAAYERYLGRWSRLFVPAVLAAAEVAGGGLLSKQGRGRYRRPILRCPNQVAVRYGKRCRHDWRHSSPAGGW